MTVYEKYQPIPGKLTSMTDVVIHAADTCVKYRGNCLTVVQEIKRTLWEFVEKYNGIDAQEAETYLSNMDYMISKVIELNRIYGDEYDLKDSENFADVIRDDLTRMKELWENINHSTIYW